MSYLINQHSLRERLSLMCYKILHLMEILTDCEETEHSNFLLVY